jgi:hypothetical protein
MRNETTSHLGGGGAGGQLFILVLFLQPVLALLVLFLDDVVHLVLAEGRVVA